MIFDIMQSNYLAPSAETIRSILAEQFQSATHQPDPELAGLMKQFQVEPADLKAALEVASEASSFLKTADGADAALLPREAAASQIQSLLQRYFLDRKRELVRFPPAAAAGETVQPISDITLDPSTAPAPQRLFRAMSQTDARWVACWAAEIYRKFAKRRPFPDTPADPIRIADDARVFLIGDWGSGISRARKIADRIKVMLAENGREQHVIHLGDVYYSGWPEEYDDHFLANWPVLPGQESKYGSWCLNGNHDMFSGGHGYFDYLMQDSRFRRQRSKGGAFPASYFSLETSRWQVLGLDSAWCDGGLAGSQLEWVETRQRDNPEKQLILLSHHQPISAFENEYQNLQPLLAKCRPTAWFWGHEHRLALYKERPDLRYGRLVGHGGVPVWAKAWKNIDDRVEYVSNRSFRSGLEKFALFGFAVLDFAGENIQVRYYDEHGQVERSENILRWPKA